MKTHGVHARACALLTIVSILLGACSNMRSTYGKVESYDLQSAYLGKEMHVSVHLPDGYSPALEYPVLYFIPYAGGGPGVVTQLIDDDPKTIAAFRSGDLRPMVIVGVPHDGSFLLDSEPPWDEVPIAGIPVKYLFPFSF